MVTRSESRQMTRLPVARLLLALLLGLSASLAPAQSPASDLESRPELRVRLQYARPGGIFDPAFWRYTSDWFVYPSLFNFLVRWVPGTTGSQLEPDLAESWTVTEDGLTYTFHLRRGVQFHKGYGELTAEDVVFTLTRQIENEEMTFHSQMANLESITAPDDYTVVIRLKEPHSSFLATIVAYRPGMVVSKRAIEELGEGFFTNPVGTGPFEFEAWTDQDEIVVVSNDAYFRGPPQVKRITFAHIGEEAIALAALQANEFQIIQTRGNPEVVEALEADPNITTRVTVMPDAVRHIAFSPDFVPTQDVRVRQALAYALQSQYVQDAFRGLEIPTKVVYYDDPHKENVPTYAYDPAKARQLLADAGYPNGFPITIMFQTRVPETNLAELVAAQWEAIGLTVTLEGTDATAAFDRRTARDYQVTVLSVGRPDPDLFFSDVFLSTSVPPGGSNYFGYAGVDDLILAARRELDPDRRVDLYHQAHVKVMEDAVIIPLSLQSFVGAWRAPVAFVEHGNNNNFWSETIDLRR